MPEGEKKDWGDPPPSSFGLAPGLSLICIPWGLSLADPLFPREASSPHQSQPRLSAHDFSLQTSWRKGQIDSSEKGQT